MQEEDVIIPRLEERFRMSGCTILVAALIDKLMLFSEKLLENFIFLPNYSSHGIVYHDQETGFPSKT